MLLSTLEASLLGYMQGKEYIEYEKNSLEPAMDPKDVQSRISNNM